MRLKYFGLSSKLKISSIIAVVLGVSCIGWSFLSVFWKKEPYVFENKKDEKSSVEVGFSSKSLDGCLNLSDEWMSFYEQDFLHEFSFFGENSRPDTDSKSSRFFASFGNSSGVYLDVGSMYYVDYKLDKLRFSDKKSLFWFRPKRVDETCLVVDIGADAPSRERTPYQKTLKIERRTCENQDFRESQPKYLEAIHSAQFLGPDKVLEVYGGKEERSCKGKFRLVQEKSIYLQENDLLVWKDGVWQGSLGVDTKKYPLLLIKEIHPDRIEGKLWDTKGVFVKKLVCPIVQRPSFNIRIEDVITHVKQRTSSCISCKVGQKAQLLRDGDWLFLQDGRWRFVRKSSDLDKIVSLSKEGELFIFDGVEKKGDALFAKGHLFDKTHTQMQVIHLPLPNKKKNRSLVNKKKPTSSKIDELFEEECLDEDELGLDFDEFDDDEDDVLIELIKPLVRHEFIQ